MRLRSKLLLLAALAWLVTPALSMAQDTEPPPDETGECASDVDCPDGSYCLQVEEYSCSMPSPCEDGDETCLSDPGGSDCSAVLVGYCMPDWLVECVTDADCGPSLLCTTFEDTYCEGGDREPCADPDGCLDPAPPEEEVCVVESYSFCLPAYLAPCQVNSDCGEGFECRLDEICWCNGGEPGDPTNPDGGEEPSPDCGCEISDTGWCEVVVQPCVDDSECAEGWTCEAGNYTDDPGDIGTCTVDPDGNETCEIIEPSEGETIDESICLPPYWSEIPGGGNDYPGDDREDDLVNEPGEDNEQPADGDDADDGEDHAAAPGVEEGGSLLGCDASPTGSGSPLAAALILLSIAYTLRRSALL